MNPKVSVIMATYNPPKSFLMTSIKSVLNQSLKDFEFIIVNDGSNEKTIKLINKCLKLDKRIKILNNKKRIGLTKSLNKAIKKARGEYIARMDDDDISRNNRIEKQLSFLKKKNVI